MGYEKWNNPDGSRKTCIRVGCDNPIKTSGVCSPHYHKERRLRLYGESTVFSLCPVQGCERRKLASSDICGGCRQTRWRYGLTIEQFLEMMEPVNRVCSNPGCDATKNLHIDHDHSCCPYGKFETKTRVSCGDCVRGWLCKSCNTSLGLMQESPERIRGLLTYLEGTTLQA